VKKGWQTKRLGDLFKIGSSKRVLKSQWKTEGVPFYRGREVTQLAADGFVDNELFISEKHFAELSRNYGVPKVDDIVITAIGTIGNAHVVRDSDRFYFKDASVLWMRRSAEVSSAFVGLWLKSPAFFQQLDRGNGATVDTLTIQKLDSLIIPLPPLPDQRRIVGILDEAFEAIATAKAAAEQNRQNARALFESHLNDIFTRKGVGWVDKKLGELCEVFADGDWVESKDQSPDGIRLIQTGNVGKGVFKDRADKARYISETTFTRLRCTEIFEGDCLISRLPDPVGRSCILPDTGVRMITAVDCTIVRFDKERLLPKYFNHYSQSDDYLRTVAKECTGTTRNRISRHNLALTPICVPPISEQNRLATEFDAMNEATTRLAAHYERKLALLEELKKSLLHRAFAGEL